MHLANEVAKHATLIPKPTRPKQPSKMTSDISAAVKSPGKQHWRKRDARRDSDDAEGGGLGGRGFCGWIEKSKMSWRRAKKHGVAEDVTIMPRTNGGS